MRTLRILLVMDPFIRVPPRHYGGIERVVASLGDELANRGHRVTLWAAPGSHIRGVVEPFGREGEWTRWSNVRNVLALARRFRAGPQRFDLVHNFGRLAYLAGVLRRDWPKVQTYMRRVSPSSVRTAGRLGARRLYYTAVSAAIRDTARAAGGRWAVVPNGVPADRYAPRFDVDARSAPLAFLGRIERCKGAHTAIAVARRLRRPLVIAGTLSPHAEERRYFHTMIEPWIDGAVVRFAGPVDDGAKQQLLGSAAALLMPVEWEEPFPVALAEALLCGTPVVAFRRGGMAEGVDHGRTGFLCQTAEEMAQWIGRLHEIDRRVCRAEGERRFSAAAIADAYEAVYRAALGEAAAPAAA